jgi:hypothetical protein
MELLRQFEVYIWAAVAIIAVIGFSVYTHQQREIGRQQIIAKDAELVHAKEIKDAEVEARAAVLVERALADYKANIAKPVADAHVVRVCQPAARRPDQGPKDGRPAPGDHGAGGLPGDVVGEDALPGRDIGQATETILRDATERVRVLQEYIRECQRSGVCKTN